MNRQQLEKSSKDRSENVMIVDLVRNDLSKICEEGSVEVKEMYGIYSYPNVHQMISTVAGQLGGKLQMGEILKATFPMGSMTGAPKRRVMELIEQYEVSSRGIYSGTIGYITPGKDFDFNVVIRSIVYNDESNYLSFHVGSAITTYSNPEDEYEECLLKSKSIMKVLSAEK
jgi:para-aminobenzoate synthetase component 1